MAASDPQTVLQQIERFLAECRSPCLVEAGEAPLSVEPGRYALSVRGGRCILEVWGEAGNLVRGITGVAGGKRGRLDLRSRRFGKSEAVLSLVDRARQSEGFERSAGHARFRETLRRILARDFPAWQVARLSSARDLERSLSPLYTRGVMRQGQQAWAVIAAGPEVGGPAVDQALTFGLIWLDEVRRSERRRAVRGLRLFLPHPHGRTTANRLLFLDRNKAQYELYEFDRHKNLSRIDDHDFGNLATELHPCLEQPALADPVAGWVEELRRNPDVEAVPRPDGLLSLRVRGLQFALAGAGVMTYGLNEQKPAGPAGFPHVRRLAAELARFRSPAAPDPNNPLFRNHPERWLESQVRSDLALIDSTLRPAPLYTQTPAAAGADRGIIDLLACDRAGRLAVLELKASEDIHLPLQGLDYWMRVKWHLDRGEFNARGYFRELELVPAPPRLLLVSPAFDFHPKTETVLQFFSPEVDVERVGAGAGWREQLHVVFRKKGAERLA